MATRRAPDKAGRTGGSYSLAPGSAPPRASAREKKTATLVIWTVAGVLLSIVAILVFSGKLFPMLGKAGSTSTNAAPKAGPGTDQSSLPPRLQKVRVLAAYFHDAFAFTQGLSIDDGRFVESTGLVGGSVLRTVDVHRGSVLAQTELPKAHFGEGSAVLGDVIYVLTWTDGVIHKYDRKTLAHLGSAPSPTSEGWGMCVDEAAGLLVVSDGSDTLTWVDPRPATPTVVKRVRVQYYHAAAAAAAGAAASAKLEQRFVPRLNELEFINGKVWANVWFDDRIVVIDPDSGRVERLIDCKDLADRQKRGESLDTANSLSRQLQTNAPGKSPEYLRGYADLRRGNIALNGIAYDKRAGSVFLTGKLWSEVYKVEVLDV